VKKLDLFDSSPKFIHIHTISVGIEIPSKNNVLRAPPTKIVK
jgi:hypothetical protein